MDDSLELQIVKRLSPLPSVPLFEQLIIEESHRICLELFEGQKKVSIQNDGFGNLIIHYSGDPNREHPRGIAYVAHADHPGFHIRKHDGMLEAELIGGLDAEKLVGSDVLLHCLGDQKRSAAGTITEEIISGLYCVKATVDEDFRFATLALPFLTERDGFVSAPVLDDIVGIASSIATMKRLIDKRVDVDIYVVIHRAEEICMLGAYALAASCLIPKNCYVISVDTSSEKAKITECEEARALFKVGGGVVLRAFDPLAGTYNRDAVELLNSVHTHLGPTSAQIPLDLAGTCEAIMYHAFGYRAAGVGIPLQGWHNGYVNEQIVPESLYLSDVESCSNFLFHLALLISQEKKDIPKIQNTIVSPELKKRLEITKQWVDAYRSRLV